MNLRVEQDFDNDENYKRLRAKQVYIFALNLVNKENAWDPDACEQMAYDLTMDAIEGLLKKEKDGVVIEKKKEYLMTCIKNALNKPKQIFFKTLNRNKLDINDSLSFVSFEDIHLNKPNLLETTSSSMDAYTVYDFIIHGNGLSIQEETVSRLLNEGYDGKEIAQKLGTSPSSISRTIAMIKLKLRDRHK